MKAMRRPVLMTILLFAVLFAAGSFLDLKLSTALFKEKNPVCLFAAAAGMMPGYGFGAFLAGILAGQIRKAGTPVLKKVLLGILALAFFFITVYFSSEDVFSVNGFYHPEYEKFSMLFSLPVMALYAFFGIRISLRQKRQDLVRIAFIILLSMMIILLLGTLGVKGILRRPRYRIVVKDCAPFHSWWQKCTDYRLRMAQFDLVSDEFKSFPSGHTSIAAMTIYFAVVIPVFVPAEEKRQRLWYALGFCYTLLIAFTRIVVGAHYLTDIAAGGLITLLGTLAVNEILIHKQAFKPEK